jgi:hypothetical protein
VCFVLSTGLLAHRTARADDPAAEEDAPHAEAPVDRRDRAPHDLWDVDSGAGPWVAVEGGLVLRDPGDRVFGAMLLVGIPLDTLARHAHRAKATREATRLDAASLQQPATLGRPPSDDDAGSETARPAQARTLLAQAPDASAPRLKAPLRRSSAKRGDAVDEPPAAPPPAPLPERAIEAPLPRPVVVTPDVARAAVKAALRHGRLLDADARLDALASRAKSSALLPELRLRATRLVDEAESLSPTEYDPGRTTATGGTSLWIEARATWRLDRLVFADEEVALERMRHDRVDAEMRLATRVLELLFAWQRASALEADPGRTPEEHLDATLHVLEAEAALDVMTDGWFSRWRRRQ